MSIAEEEEKTAKEFHEFHRSFPWLAAVITSTIITIAMIILYKKCCPCKHTLAQFMRWLFCSLPCLCCHENPTTNHSVGQQGAHYTFGGSTTTINHHNATTQDNDSMELRVTNRTPLRSPPPASSDLAPTTTPSSSRLTDAEIRRAKMNQLKKINKKPHVS